MREYVVFVKIGIGSRTNRPTNNLRLSVRLSFLCVSIYFYIFIFHNNPQFPVHFKEVWYSHIFWLKDEFSWKWVRSDYFLDKKINRKKEIIAFLKSFSYKCSKSQFFVFCNEMCCVCEHVDLRYKFISLNFDRLL